MFSVPRSDPKYVSLVTQISGRLAGAEDSWASPDGCARSRSLSGPRSRGPAPAVRGTPPRPRATRRAPRVSLHLALPCPLPTPGSIPGRFLLPRPARRRDLVVVLDPLRVEWPRGSDSIGAKNNDLHPDGCSAVGR